MDGIGISALGLGGLLLLAALLRGLARATRCAVRSAARAGTAASSRARIIGVRGLFATATGAATASVAGATTSAASAAPTWGSPAATMSPTSAAPAPVHLVGPGDSLWAIAARSLGPGASDAEIAAEWPRWYRANRAVIGSNPSLLLVGTSLTVPHGRRTGTSASPHHTRPQSDSGRTALTLDPDRR